MEFTQVRSFLTIVDQGGFGAAARALGVTQPSLSQSIRRLEADVGQRLFERSGRHVQLTDAGRQLLEPARQLAAEAAALTSAVEAVRDLRSGVVTIAALGTLAADPLPGMLSSFAACHPDLRYHIVDPPEPGTLVQWVSDGDAELGLTDISTGTGALAAHELAAQEIVVVVPPSAAGALPAPLPLSMVSDLEFIMLSRGTDDLLETGFTIRGHPVRGVVECWDWGTLFHLVRAGAGATLMSRTVAEAQFDPAMIRTTVPVIERTVGLVHRPGGLSPAGSAFLAASVPLDGRTRPLD